MDTQQPTLDLDEAARFLRLSPAVLRQKARAGIIKGAKPGKRWVFLERDLVTYLDSLYYGSGQTLLCDADQEITLCHSLNAAKSGGLDLPPPTASKYASLLKLKTDS